MSTPQNFNWSTVIDAGDDRLLYEIEDEILEVLHANWPNLDLDSDGYRELSEDIAHCEVVANG